MTMRIGAYEVAPYHDNPASFHIRRINQDATRTVIVDDINDEGVAIDAARALNASDVCGGVTKALILAETSLILGDTKAAAREVRRALDMLTKFEVAHAC